MNTVFKIMRILPILVTLLILTMITPENNIVYSIVKRNSQEYPVKETSISIKELEEILRELEKLNDTNIDKYIDKIQESINEGNYNEALEYLEKLTSYLKEKYSYGDINNISELAKYIALLDSIEKLDNESITIDVEKLLKEYKEILKSSDEEIDFSFKDLYDILSNTTFKREKLLETQNNLLNPGIDTSYNPSISSPIPSLGILLKIPLETIMYIGVLTLIPLILYIFRKQINKYLYPVKKTIYSVTENIISIISPFKDPVIKLYNKWYLKTKLHGYRRYNWETLREYLGKIKDNKLRVLGEKITSLYETRIYGGKEIDHGIIEDLRRKLGFR